MNILITSQHFYPEEFRINEIAIELKKRGNNVEVITGLPNYPEGEIYKGYENKLEEEYNGVLIHRTKIRPRHKGSVNLFLNYISYVNNSVKTVDRVINKPDLVFAYETSPIFQVIPAINAKKKYDCKMILMNCDQWPVSLNARGLSKGFIYNVISKISTRIYQSADFILNTSPSFIEYNHKIHNIPYEKQDWCIHPCIDNFKDIDTHKEPNGNIDLLFAGNIGKVQNVQDIIKAYNELRYPNLYIHIYGDGSDYEECKKLAKQLNVEHNVKLYGRISKQELISKYKEIDACLLTLSDKSLIGNTIPAKLIEYMSASKPILAAANGDSTIIIKESKCGKDTTADNYKELASLINDYYKNIKSYKEYNNNAREYYLKNCTIERFIDKLEGTIS